VGNIAGSIGELPGRGDIIIIINGGKLSDEVDENF
jgi:hypothetical protein